MIERCARPAAVDHGVPRLRAATAWSMRSPGHGILATSSTQFWNAWCARYSGARGASCRAMKWSFSGVGVPDDDTARIEEVLGVPIGAMRFPLAAYPSFATPCSGAPRPSKTTFPSRMISMFHHLNDAEQASVRQHLGPGPAAGSADRGRGCAAGSAPRLGPERCAAAQAGRDPGRSGGLAWHRVEERPSAAGAVRTSRLTASSDLARRHQGDHRRRARFAQRCSRWCDSRIAPCSATRRSAGSRRETVFRQPDDLFAGAALACMKREVDAACLVAAFAAGPQAIPATLFVNVAVETLVEGRNAGDRLARLADGAGIDPERRRARGQ